MILAPDLVLADPGIDQLAAVFSSEFRFRTPLGGLTVRLPKTATVGNAPYFFAQRLEKAVDRLRFAKDGRPEIQFDISLSTLGVLEVSVVERTKFVFEGRTHALAIDATATVAAMKTKLTAAIGNGIPPLALAIRFNGGVVEDAATLKDLNYRRSSPPPCVEVAGTEEIVLTLLGGETSRSEKFASPRRRNWRKRCPRSGGGTAWTKDRCGSV
jgi:hypothetical protein